MESGSWLPPKMKKQSGSTSKSPMPHWSTFVAPGFSALAALFSLVVAGASCFVAWTTYSFNATMNRPFLKVEFIQSDPAAPSHIENPSRALKGPLIFGTLTVKNLGNSPAFNVRYRFFNRKEGLSLSVAPEPITIAAHDSFQDVFALVSGEKPFQNVITFLSLNGRIYYQDASKTPYDEQASVMVQVGGDRLERQLTVRWGK